ncbi:class I SAM-dependent methyltransferase [Streptomyces sp. NPDC059063]|uniref:class I SAM-dependent methyltransferase n=1 Tax=unclassified Streptomyces TaxID=2593676 RepID=UPI003697F0FF
MDTAARLHRARTRALARLVEPESWLDVGTGHARFPAVAKDVLPYTSFDGLDREAHVEAARDAGAVEEAHRGELTDLAPRLAGRYDVVSLFHQLERAADPRAELRAARTALRPGGYLVIEAYDPAPHRARLLGRRWAARSEARHPHLLPLARLRRDLADLGLTVVAVERHALHVPSELTTAAALAVGRLLSGPRRRGFRRACRWTAARLLAAVCAVDPLLAPLLARTGISSAYRVVARRAPGD